MIVCWSAKGAAGTTTFVASWALSLTRPALVVDLDGDLPTVFGIDASEAPGVLDWLGTDTPAERLASLEIEISPSVSLLPAGATPPTAGAEPDAARWAELESALDADPRAVVVDAGRRPPPGWVPAHSWLVTRPCYLALRDAMAHPSRPTGVVVVGEPGRALRRDDVECSVGAPVVVELLADPAVSRAVDAGLLRHRLPVHLRRALRSTAA